MTGVPDGWPCALLAATPPSILDREAAPTADDVLPQVLALTPRGPAWGTDEAGDGRGASPVQRSFWRGIAAWVADHLGRDFTAASQTFPSAVTYTLADWEAELGLPDSCGAPTDTAGRIQAVRARFGALGGASPAYFVCLAQSAGYAATIEEPTQFLVDVSEVVGPDLMEGYFSASSNASDPGDVCDAGNVVETGFVCDDGVCGDPVEVFAFPGSDAGTPLEYLLPAAAADPGDQVAGVAPEETDFICDDGVCDGTPLQAIGEIDPNGSVWKDWVVHLVPGNDTAFQCDAPSVAEDGFFCDDGVCGDPVETFSMPAVAPSSDTGSCDDTPIEGFVGKPDIECLIQARTPPHTRVTFAYDLAA